VKFSGTPTTATTESAENSTKTNTTPTAGSERAVHSASSSTAPPSKTLYESEEKAPTRKPDNITAKQSSTPMPKPRRNDSQWRADVLELRGEYCRSCHTSHWLQIDHIKPRSQGGTSVVENGTVLCQHCHDLKTRRLIKYYHDWLDPDQHHWLKTIGWVWWDQFGEPHGRGYKGFHPQDPP
jgi:5-methylcytosine-specific restriction endonuclease McrA